VAEQFTFEQRLRQRGAVDRDERVRDARTQPVQRTRHQFLARPALAQDQDSGLQRRKPRDLAKQFTDRDAFAPNARFGRAHALAQKLVLGAQAVEITLRFEGGSGECRDRPERVGAVV